MRRARVATMFSMRRLFAAFIAVLLLAALFAVQAARAHESGLGGQLREPPPPAAAKPAPYVPPADGPIASDGYYETIERVAEGVWVIRQKSSFHLQPIGNVTVIEQADGLVMVDGGGSPGSARRIAGLIRQVSSKPVKALILTHWHGDHSLGFGSLKAVWPRMEVIATAVTRDRLATSMTFYAQGGPDPVKTAEFMARLNGIDGFLRDAAVNPQITEADRAGFAQGAREFVRYRADADGLFVGAVTRTFTDGLVLADHVREIRVFHPGKANTDGDAAVWVKGSRVLITGDLVVAPIPFGFNSYPGEWLKSLDVLLGHDFAVMVPGHGAPMTDPSYAVKLKTLIETTRARVAPLALAGKSLEDVRKQVDLADQAAIFAGDDPWLRRWFRAYWVEPFVEAAWKEAKGIPIEQGRG